jgi:hypothetical protein
MDLGLYIGPNDNTLISLLSSFKINHMIGTYVIVRNVL